MTVTSIPQLRSDAEILPQRTAASHSNAMPNHSQSQSQEGFKVLEADETAGENLQLSTASPRPVAPSPPSTNATPLGAAARSLLSECANSGLSFATENRSIFFPNHCMSITASRSNSIDSMPRAYDKNSPHDVLPVTSTHETSAAASPISNSKQTPQQQAPYGALVLRDQEQERDRLEYLSRERLIQPNVARRRDSVGIETMSLTPVGRVEGWQRSIASDLQYALYPQAQNFETAFDDRLLKSMTPTTTERMDEEADCSVNDSEAGWTTEEPVDPLWWQQAVFCNSMNRVVDVSAQLEQARRQLRLSA
jgi:hypothetical protein